MTRKTGRPRGRPTNLEKERIYKVGAAVLSEMETNGGATFMSPEELDALGIEAFPAKDPGRPATDPGKITRAHSMVISGISRWIKLIAELDDNRRRTPEEIDKLIRERRGRGEKLPPDPWSGWWDEPSAPRSGEAHGLAGRSTARLGDLIKVVEEERRGDPLLTPADTPERLARRISGLPVFASPERRVKDLRYREKRQEEDRAERYATRQAESLGRVFRDLADLTNTPLDEFILELNKRLGGRPEDPPKGPASPEEGD